MLRDIKGLAGEDAILTWAGKTAESFTAEFEDAPGKLKKLKKSYEMAGDAVSTLNRDGTSQEVVSDVRDGPATSTTHTGASSSPNP